jgi:hypothetical protein
MMLSSPSAPSPNLSAKSHIACVQVLTLDSCVLDHAPGIGLKAGHSAADVTVDLYNLLDGGCLKESRGNTLLYTKDHTFTSRHLYCE